MGVMTVYNVPSDSAEDMDNVGRLRRAVQELVLGQMNHLTPTQ